ncbi:hypothetical protein Tco_1324371, partial [Tanacetum coccineum]
MFVVMIDGEDEPSCYYVVSRQIGRVKGNYAVSRLNEERLHQPVHLTMVEPGAQGDREAGVFQVSNDDAAVAQRRLEPFLARR